MIKDAMVVEIDRRNATVQTAFEGTGDNELTLTPAERRVAVTMTDGDSVIFMPPVAKCAGHFYTIHIVAFTGASLTIRCNGDDKDATLLVDGDKAAAIVLEAANEYAVLFSDGLFWHSVAYYSA